MPIGHHRPQTAEHCRIGEKPGYAPYFCPTLRIGHGGELIDRYGDLDVGSHGDRGIAANDQRREGVCAHLTGSAGHGDAVGDRQDPLPQVHALAPDTRASGVPRRGRTASGRSQPPPAATVRVRCADP